MFRWLSALVILAVISFAVHADSSKQEEAIKAKLVESFPTHTPDSVSKSAVEGLYEAVYGTQVIYVTEDARYVIQGVVMDLEDGKRDITAVASSNARKKYMTQVEQQENIAFGSDKPKHTVTVFTDIDCGYCRKLHNEMDQYASYGIKVNYLLFPRNGITTPSYTKAVSVWCNKDRAEALTRAKNGEELPAENCDNPVADHFEIGKKIGVSGTPAILTADGELMPGYMPAEVLAQRLDELAKN
ncbi:MAG: DsbC family protein [Gammaproteobacteria bacterium]|nr:DsbC family protein [Gammaproteobacteria bacterium]